MLEFCIISSTSFSIFMNSVLDDGEHDVWVFEVDGFDFTGVDGFDGEGDDYVVDSELVV